MCDLMEDSSEHEINLV